MNSFTQLKTLFIPLAKVHNPTVIISPNVKMAFQANSQCRTISNKTNCKQKSKKKAKIIFFLTDKNRADKNYRDQESDKLIRARMRRIRTETKKT